MRKKYKKLERGVFVRLPEDIQDKLRRYCFFKKISLREMLIRHISRIEAPEFKESCDRSQPDHQSALQTHSSQNQ
jgi:hypothetical protein